MNIILEILIKGGIWKEILQFIGNFKIYWKSYNLLEILQFEQIRLINYITKFTGNFTI